MKSTSLFTIAATMALLFSCQIKLEDENVSISELDTNNGEIVFYASSESNPDSKAVVQEDARSIWWEPGDQIQIYCGSEESTFTTSIDSPAASAEFTGSFSAPVADGNSYFAVYPASAAQSFDGNVFTIYIPSEQRPPKGSFDRNAMVAIAQSDNRNLTFKHVCGGIKFSVSRPDIDKVIIRTFERKTTGTFSVRLNSSGIPVLESEDAASNIITLTPGDGGYFEPGAYYYAALFPKTSVRTQVQLYSSDQLIGAYLGWKEVFKRATSGVLSNLDQKLDYVIDNIPKPDAIDLGLPSGNLWASFNLGASKPEESGYYYAWGETIPKNLYDWKTYLWCEGSSSTLTKYNSSSNIGAIDNKQALDPNDDAAAMALGDNWSMPSPDDVEELIANCTWTWSTVNGVKGYYVKSKVNDARIFIPAAGNMKYGDRTESFNSEGFYLCNTAVESSINVKILLFASFAYYLSSTREPYSSRSRGLTIRPIHKPAVTEPRYINVSPSSYTLETGQTLTISAAVGPDGDYDHSITWRSSNTAVATVDNNGIVTAIAAGSATITARTTNNLTAECKVTVTKPIVSVTGISISKESLELFADGSAQLTASVIPSNATEKSVIWSSNNASVATVSTSGLVRAISNGNATITVTSKDGGFKKTCSVTVQDMPVPTAVDLGLSVKWASFNVGAASPEDEGCLYAWGETSTKDSYTVENYKWWEYMYVESNIYTLIIKKYKDDNEYASLNKPDNTLEKEDDVAYVKYGGKWHMPSCVQIKELIDKCEWTYTKIGNVYGYKVKSKKNSNYIFLPIGGYWSSSLDSSKWYSKLKQSGLVVGDIDNYLAYAFWVNEPGKLGTQYRYVDEMVRAVYGEDYY